MNFTASDWLSLAVQIPVEFLGAWFCLKRHAHWSLLLMLSFAGCFDVSAIAAHFWRAAYCYGYWWMQPVAYATVGILAVSACGELAKARKRETALIAAIVGILIGGGIVAKYSLEPFVYNRLLDTEIGADAVIMVALFLGMMPQLLTHGQIMVSKQWQWIIAGLWTLLVSDALLAAVNANEHWYAIGQIISGAMFLTAAVQERADLAWLAAAKKEEVRLPMSATVKGIWR